MINEDAIKEIYKACSKSKNEKEDFNLPYFQGLLEEYNPIEIKDELVIIKNVDEFSPFKRFLLRSLKGVFEFDKTIAFVFNTHILFMEKYSDEVRIHLKPEKKEGFFKRLFS
jgi:hypothetical protein